MKFTNIESRCVVDDEGRRRNLSLTKARGLPSIQQGSERTETLAIVAAGPSVPDYLEEIKSHDVIWAVNGAYGYLLDFGIVPAGFVSVDPLPSLSGYVDRARKETTFYLNAECDPSVFDKLEGFKVELWIPEKGDADIAVIPGGTTSVTRAPFVAKHMGFRKITLFGVDSSFSMTSRYCYEYGTFPDDSKAPVLTVMCNGEGPFYSEICLMKQVSQLGVMAMYPWGVDFKIKCGGLMDAYLRSPMEDEDGVYAP